MKSDARKTIGIIGGMGPLATVTLFSKIVTKTAATSDQEHARIVVDNNTTIPDRTDHILNGGADPIPHLIESARLLENAGADFLIMPCNTAHNFYAQVAEVIEIPFLNMITETVQRIKKEHPAGSKIGLLATEGTVASEIYHRLFNAEGFQIVVPEKDMQEKVSRFIYDVKGGGDKSGGMLLQAAADALFDHGCVSCILGCTELSVGHDQYGFVGNFVDPLEVIAEQAITYAGYPVVE